MSGTKHREKHVTEIDSKEQLEETATEQDKNNEEAVRHDEQKREKLENRRKVEREKDAEIKASTDIMDVELEELSSSSVDEALRDDGESGSQDDSEDIPLDVAEDHAAVADAGGVVKKRSKAQRNLYAQYMIAGSTLVTTMLTAAVAISGFVYAKQAADGKPPSNPGDVTVATIVNAWLQKTDAELWDDLATYVGANEDQVTLADEILFLKTIESMSPQVAWIWETLAVKAAAIAACVADYTAAANSTPAMYRHILDHKYLNADSNQVEVLPRRVAAEVLKLAVGRITRTST